MRNNVNSEKNLLEKFSGYTLNNSLGNGGLNSRQFTNLPTKIKMITRGESVRNFMENTKDIILAKYQLEIKKERLKREKEVMDNELEAVSENFELMKRSKQMFINEFKSNFESYIKLLREKREGEKIILNKLLSIKYEKESKVKVIESNIVKLKEDRLDKFGDYKNFIFCVKNQVLFEPDEYQKESNALITIATQETKNVYNPDHLSNLTSPSYTKSHLINRKSINDFEKIDPHNNVFLTTQLNTLNTESAILKKDNIPNQSDKFKTTALPVSRYSLPVSRYSQSIIKPTNSGSIEFHNMHSILEKPAKKYFYDSVLPFKDINDFLEEFRKIESENVKFILKYNSQMTKLGKLEKEVIKLKQQDEERHLLERAEVENHMRSYNEIALSNEKLKSEKAELEKLIHSSERSPSKLKKTPKLSYASPLNSKLSLSIISPIVLNSKVKNLYDKCRDFVLVYLVKANKNEKMVQKIKALPNPVESKNVLVEYLRLIEITLDYLNSKFKYLKVNKLEELTKKENKLNTERKVNKAREQQLDKQLKQEKNKELIFEKYAKVVPVHKRKVMLKSRPLLRQHKIKKKPLNEDQINFEDLLAEADNRHEVILKTVS